MSSYYNLLIIYKIIKKNCQTKRRNYQLCWIMKRIKSGGLDKYGGSWNHWTCFYDLSLSWKKKAKSIVNLFFFAMSTFLKYSKSIGKALSNAACTIRDDEESYTTLQSLSQYISCKGFSMFLCYDVDK